MTDRQEMDRIKNIPKPSQFILILTVTSGARARIIIPPPSRVGPGESRVIASLETRRRRHLESPPRISGTRTEDSHL